LARTRHPRCRYGAEEQVDVGVLATFLGEGLEAPNLFGVGAVAFAHRDVAARVEEDVPQPARIAEAALLRIPFGRHAQPVACACDADGGVVGRLDDGHVAGGSVGHAPERHADAVAAVGDEPHRTDRLVGDGVGDALVHGNHEVGRPLAARQRVGREGVGERERSGEVGVGRQGDGELGPVGFKGDDPPALDAR